MLLIELCKCTPFSNATLERFFNKNLNSIMRIKMNNLSVADFNTKYFLQCIDCWCNIKERLGKTKRKKYAPRNSTKRRRSQWCNVTFWALTKSGEWNRLFWDFYSLATKSTRPTIFRKIQFAFVLSHFLMLEVFYAYKEEYKHNDYVLKTKQTFAICTK